MKRMPPLIQIIHHKIDPHRFWSCRYRELILIPLLARQVDERVWWVGLWFVGRVVEVSCGRVFVACHARDFGVDDEGFVWVGGEGGDGGAWGGYGGEVDVGVAGGGPGVEVEEASRLFGGGDWEGLGAGEGGIGVVEASVRQYPVVLVTDEMMDILWVEFDSKRGDGLARSNDQIHALAGVEDAGGLCAGSGLDVESVELDEFDGGVKMEGESGEGAFQSASSRSKVE